MKTGALQPWPVRHVTTPWPYWPPKTNAPLINPGTTATHVACCRMFIGMLLILGAHNLVENNLGGINAVLQILL